MALYQIATAIDKPSKLIAAIEKIEAGTQREAPIIPRY